MQSASQTVRGAAEVVRPGRAPRLACLLAAAMAGLGLAACAEPSPQRQVAAADASQPATAGPDAAGEAAATESAAAATAESKPGSTDATASESASSPADTVDNSTSTAPAAAPSAEPQAASDTATSPAATAEPKPDSTATTASGSAPPSVGTADNSSAAAPSTEPQAASDTAPAASAAAEPQTAAAAQAQPPSTAEGAAPPGSGLATGRPYVVIRFTETTVDYEKALAEAVKRAVARKPDLAFDMVAVTPRAGSAEELADLTEKAHAEAAAVMKSLSALGIGPERVSMMTWTGQSTDVNEIRLYIR